MVILPSSVSNISQDLFPSLGALRSCSHSIPRAPPGRAGTYPPLSVGVRPNRVQSPTDMSRELSTVTTAASARPHLDFTMSIFPGKQHPAQVTRESKRN